MKNKIRVRSSCWLNTFQAALETPPEWVAAALDVASFDATGFDIAALKPADPDVAGLSTAGLDAAGRCAEALGAVASGVALCNEAVRVALKSGLSVSRLPASCQVVLAHSWSKTVARPIGRCPFISTSSPCTRIYVNPSRRFCSCLTFIARPRVLVSSDFEAILDSFGPALGGGSILA